MQSFLQSTRLIPSSETKGNSCVQYRSSGSSSSGGGSSGGSSSRGNRYNAVHSISMHIRSIVLSYMFFPQNIRERLPLRGSKWKTHC